MHSSLDFAYSKEMYQKQNTLFPEKIISGGQTGADRGALDACLILGVPHGGYCPLGRKSEDGEIPPAYMLIECKSSNYLVRTELNVKESDATVIFMLPNSKSRGSKRTVDFCVKHGKNFVILGAFPNRDKDATRLLEFLAQHAPKTLNVAGSRESSVPGLSDHVHDVIVRVLGLIWESQTRFETQYQEFIRPRNM